MFTIQNGNKTQYGLVGSKFARTKRTIYVGLTLKESIALLPKEIEQYILEYLDSHNIFAMDRASRSVMQSALYLYYNLHYDCRNLNGMSRNKVSYMDKPQMIECVSQYKIPIQYYIYKTLYRNVMWSLRARQFEIRKIVARTQKKADQKTRQEQEILAKKQLIQNGGYVKFTDNTCGIITAFREKTVTAYCVESNVNYMYDDTSDSYIIHITLTGRKRVVSYKNHFMAITELCNLRYETIVLHKDDKEVSVLLSELPNSAIITSRIKSIVKN